MHLEPSTESENEHLSIPEIRAKLEKLTEADIHRLSLAGKQYAWQCSMDGSDLLNEAIARSLSGERKCPRDESFIALLVMTMRSIASDEKRKAKLIPIQEAIDEDPANDPLFSVVAKEQTPLESLETNNELDDLYKIFHNDEGVTMLLMGLHDGLNPEEICKLGNWDTKTYNTIRKRLRRGVMNNFPDGRQT